MMIHHNNLKNNNNKYIIINELKKKEKVEIVYNAKYIRVSLQKFTSFYV